MQEELFKAHHLPPPQALTDFTETVLAVIPQAPGSEVQQAADDNRPIVGSDDEFTSDEEEDIPEASRSMATTSKGTARNERRVRRGLGTVKKGGTGAGNTSAGAVKRTRAGTRTRQPESEAQELPGVSPLAATTQLCTEVSMAYISVYPHVTAFLK